MVKHMSDKIINEAHRFGTRIPCDYFCSTGIGQTDLGKGIDPWETGAYDLALMDAGIQDYNIVQYTSVIPKEAKQWPRKKLEHLMHHGAVLETIMANINGKKGDHLCAGIGIAMVYRKKDNFCIGGYACEYEGHAKKSAAKKILTQSLQGLFERRFDPKKYRMGRPKFTIADCVVAKHWGTVIASINFVTYLHPKAPEIK